MGRDLMVRRSTLPISQRKTKIDNDFTQNEYIPDRTFVGE